VQLEKPELWKPSNMPPMVNPAGLGTPPQPTKKETISEELRGKLLEVTQEVI